MGELAGRRRASLVDLQVAGRWAEERRSSTPAILYTGIRDEDVEWTVKTLEARYGETFKPAFDDLQDLNGALLRFLVDAGVISEKTLIGAGQRRELRVVDAAFRRGSEKELLHEVAVFVADGGDVGQRHAPNDLSAWVDLGESAAEDAASSDLALGHLDARRAPRVAPSGDPPRWL